METVGLATCRKCQGSGRDMVDGKWVGRACPQCKGTGSEEMKAVEQPSEGIGELIERLCIANMKLWAVCDKKANAANMSQEDLRVLVADDLNLCKSRAAIRAEINRRLGTASGETVKHYGETLREAAKGWEEFIDKEGFPPIIPPGNATIRG